MIRLLLSDFLHELVTLTQRQPLSMSSTRDDPVFDPKFMIPSLWPLSGTSIQILFYILEDGPI